MSEQWYNDNSGSGDNENNNQNGYQYTSQEDYAFQTLMRNGRPKTKTLSVASMVLGILSVVCCCLGYVGIVFGIGAIVVSIISRKSLGYFDGIGVAGLVLGIFALAFGAAVFVLGLFTDVLYAIKNLL